MHLITVAHLGEAQNIIQEWNLEKMSTDFYQGADISCLITGEGPFESAVKTSRILGQSKFDQVINLGICGSLNPELMVLSIHPVRTIYLVIDGKPQFKTFPVSKIGLDLITSFERILSPEKAKVLSGVGELVDREAWGVAMAAKEAQVPFQSFKLISDQAGTIAACEVIREKAEELSDLLATFLKTHLSKKLPEDKSVFFADPAFHFTFSTRKAFETNVKKLMQRKGLSLDDLLGSLKVDELKLEKCSSKERTKILLQMLQTELDPFQGKLEERLERWRSPLKDQGISLQPDLTWETPTVKIHFETHGPEDLKSKVQHLSQIDWETFERIRKGDLNVE